MSFTPKRAEDHTTTTEALGPSVPLVLASGSPRRSELLSGLGLSFTVQPAAIDERALQQQLGAVAPEVIAEQLARAKAAAVVEVCRDAVVIGADTIVVRGGWLLGKPRDAAEAEAMLSELSGRTHVVITGYAVIGPGRAPVSGVERTNVTFRRLTADVIARYVASGEPSDKAGAYAIQGRGAVLIERIEGDYFNVVGLPLARLAEALAPYGYVLP